MELIIVLDSFETYRSTSEMTDSYTHTPPSGSEVDLDRQTKSSSPVSSQDAHVRGRAGFRRSFLSANIHFV